MKIQKSRIAMFIVAVAVCLLPLFAHASVSVTVNGTTHTIPQTNEKGWGTNVTAWIQAISQYTLQPSGGSFLLTADTDFGANFGLKSIYLKSRATNPSTSGVLRAGNAEYLGWRNAANSGNLLLGVNSSDQLTYNGVVLAGSSGVSFQDSTFNIFDEGDITKKIAFQASGITTGTTRTLTVPDASGSLLLNDNTATVTNKTISGASNTITNVSLTSGVTGALPLGNGGTGQTTKAAAFDALSPMTTSGDLIYGGASGTGTRLAKGTDGQVLTLASGLPSWAAAGTASPLTTKGDVYIYNSTNARLPVGQSGQVITPSPGATNGVAWRNPTFRNFLLNPGFEDGANADTSWTSSAGTDSADTTNFHDDAQALSISLSSVNGAVISQDVTPSPYPQLSGTNMEFSVWVKTASTTIQVCARQAGATVGSCANVPGTNTWQPITINYPGTNSGSWGIGIQTSSSTSGTVKLDNAYVGPATNVSNISQAQFIGSAYFATTASCTWSRTNTALGAFSTTAACPGPTVESNPGPGVIQTTDTDLPKVTVNNLPPGNYMVVVHSTVYESTSGANGAIAISDGTTIAAARAAIAGITTSIASGNLTAFFTYTTTGNRTFEIYGRGDSGSTSIDNAAGADQTSFAIYRFPSAGEIAVRSDNSNFDWVTCPAISGSWVSNTTYNCKWRRQGSNAIFDMLISTSGAPTSASLTVTLPITIDTTKLNSTTAGVEIFGTAVPLDSGVAEYAPGHVRYSSSTVVDVRYVADNTTNPPITASVTQAAPFTFGSGDSVHLRFSVPVSGWSENQNAPLLVGSVTSKTTGMERVERYRVGSTGGGCSISTTSDTGTTGSSPATGKCQITFGTAWASAPTCAVSVYYTAGTSTFTAIVDAATAVPSTTTVNIAGISTAGAYAATDGFSMTCMGPR